jgi:hypothetical protein
MAAFRSTPIAISSCSMATVKLTKEFLLLGTGAA